NQVGRLTHMGNGLNATFNEYDTIGRAKKVQHVIGNSSYLYTTTYAYATRAVSGSELGNVLATSTFPDGEQVAYTYDAGGLQRQVKTTPCTAYDLKNNCTTYGTQQTVVSTTIRNARGETVEVDYGNGAQQYHCYNDGSTCNGVVQSNTDLRLHQIITAL